jgi:hypothetical protein
MSVSGFVIGAFGVREVFITAGILSAISYVILYPTVHIEQSKVIAQEA